MTQSEHIIPRYCIARASSKKGVKSAKKSFDSQKGRKEEEGKKKKIEISQILDLRVTHQVTS